MPYQRIATAAIGIPAVVAVILYLPPQAFLICMICIVALALHEYFTMALPHDARGERAAGIILGCLVMLAFYSSTYDLPPGAGRLLLPAACVVVCVTALFFYTISAGHTPRECLERIVRTAFGIVYIAVPLSYAVAIRARDDGTLLLIALIAVTWAGDSAGYIVGSMIGKRKLCPQISPGKTIEGAAGSCVAAIAALLLCAYALQIRIGPAQAIILGICMNAANQFGDITESLIKRACSVKDSGSLLPGHGGMLDRIDSLLLATPLLYYFFSCVHPAP